LKNQVLKDFIHKMNKDINKGIFKL